MKIVTIALCLFVIGCGDIDPINKRMDIIDSKVNLLTEYVARIQENRNPAPKFDSPECVLFNKNVDTHAIVSVVIPVSGMYKYNDWGETKERYFQAGQVIDRVKSLVRSTCPSYKDFK